MLGNDEDMLKYYQEKGMHVYAESDGRNKFDGKYGFLTYNKTKEGKNVETNEWIIAVGLHPAIISGKEWIATQILIEKNKSKSYRAISNGSFPQKQSIVSGLLRCKNCGTYMRPKNMDRRRNDGSVNYRYVCALKEKSRGHKCKGLNVPGEELDKKILEILKTTFVPNSDIYNELKNMTKVTKTTTNNNELACLENAYKSKNKEIDDIVEKLKYIDKDLIDIINEPLKKLKKEKEELEFKIANLKSQKTTMLYDNNLEVQTAKDILKIIDNSFNAFDTYDLKTKRDIANLFIENIYGNGDDIEINLLNTQIEESKKNYIYLYP